MPKALITGITGQDGFYLTKLLLSKGYEVFGFARSEPSSDFITSFNNQVKLYLGDLANQQELTYALQNIHPDEIYHLASQSKPSMSWVKPAYTMESNGLGALSLFEAVRTVCPNAKVYHASSSEMFGQSKIVPQNEETPFAPTNPYAASKVYAHQMARIYRESYGLFIASGILFNHESERRPLHFVTQKIAYGAACAALDIQDSPQKNEHGLPIVFQGQLALGSLAVARDWGYAPDFVRAMWLMLQQNKPDDFVIGTGKLHSIRNLCEIAYGYVEKDWKKHVISDPALVRPLETNQSVADATKARTLLGWEPSLKFEAMIINMVKRQQALLETHRDCCTEY